MTLSTPGRRLLGSAALVTGAGNGIGMACATRLAAEGARVAAADLDFKAAQSTVQSLLDPNPHGAFAMDVTDRASVDRAVHETAALFGQLDILVNVAGGDVQHPKFEDTDDSVWASMLDLNLTGVARCCR